MLLVGVKMTIRKVNNLTSDYFGGQQQPVNPKMAITTVWPSPLSVSTSCFFYEMDSIRIDEKLKVDILLLITFPF